MQTVPQPVVNTSFETFKAFENLSLQVAAHNLMGAPNSIWQIIDHLNTWMSHQLKQIHKENFDSMLEEQSTWKGPVSPENLDELENGIRKLYGNIEDAKIAARRLVYGDPVFTEKLLIIQEMSNHLAFHIGEVVLIRRMCQNYPNPEKMKPFLTDD